MNKLNTHLLYMLHVDFMVLKSKEKIRLDYFYTTPKMYFGCYDTVKSEYDENEIVPILRPMWTVTSSELDKIGLDFHKSRRNKTIDLSPVQVMKCIELGLDVFGLIDEKLAIDATK